MAKITIEEVRPGIQLNTSEPLDKATIDIVNFVPINNVEVLSLISKDTPNDLKLGSDNKLVSQPNDVNFLAYYTLSKG